MSKDRRPLKQFTPQTARPECRRQPATDLVPHFVQYDATGDSVAGMVDRDK
nr:hypothetical protein [Actinocrispum wychmicini]